MKNKLSFCAEAKDALRHIEPKKKCCKRTFDDATAAFGGAADTSFTASDVLEQKKCENCLKEFLRASFLEFGLVTDPAKDDHLEFSVSGRDDFDAVKRALEEAGFSPKESERNGKKVLYFKKNETVGDFLAYIGALSSAFDIMNVKLVREMRNETNRIVNCETANIKKAVESSQKYIEAIEYLQKKGSLTVLPDELREAAELRAANHQASLGELASKCSPPITKSGMKHRLEKILAFAAEKRSKESE